MSAVLMGQRCRRIGEADRLWVVSGLGCGLADTHRIVLLMSEDGTATSYVELIRLADPKLYQAVAPSPIREPV